MNEAEYCAHVAPLMLRTARRVARFHPEAHEDLAQIGAIAALKLYRQADGEPSTALTVCAAQRAMCHELRKVYRQKRAGAECSLDEKILKPGGQREADAIRRLDVGRALERLTSAEREVIELGLAGHTAEEISQGIDETPWRVARIRSGAVKKLRHILAAA